MKKKIKSIIKKVVAVPMAAVTGCMLIASSNTINAFASQKEDEVIKLRVCNWEEYIDIGEWEEDEVIDLEDGTEIFGENSMIDDFEDWYYEMESR